jgi:hypothetical protein
MTPLSHRTARRPAFHFLRQINDVIGDSLSRHPT